MDNFYSVIEGYISELDRNEGGPCTFTVLLEKKYRDARGVHEKVFYFKVKTFDRLAASCSKILNKGSHVLVSGTFRGDGDDRYLRAKEVSRIMSTG